MSLPGSFQGHQHMQEAGFPSPLTAGTCINDDSHEQAELRLYISVGFSSHSLTCRGAGVQVAGAVLDTDALAVGAPVGRHGVGALTLGQLHATTTRPRALPVGRPLGPAAVHLVGHGTVRPAVPFPAGSIPSRSSRGSKPSLR